MDEIKLKFICDEIIIAINERKNNIDRKYNGEIFFVQDPLYGTEDDFKIHYCGIFEIGTMRIEQVLTIYEIADYLSKYKEISIRVVEGLIPCSDYDGYIAGSYVNKKVFLGGTCAETNWREQLIPHLNIDYFNPIVEDWTEECIAEEERQKEICGIHLYLITSEMKGVYSIAEVVQSSHNKNIKTLFCINPDGFSEGELRSLKAVYGLVESNGAVGYIGNDIKEVSKIINRL